MGAFTVSGMGAFKVSGMKASGKQKRTLSIAEWELNRELEIGNLKLFLQHQCFYKM